MVIGVPKESFPGARRVALTPHVIPSLTAKGVSVVVETESGQTAGYPDNSYAEKGARVISSRAEVFASADVILQIHALGSNPAHREAELPLLRSNQVLIGLMNPLGGPEAIREASTKGVTAFALELIPRIARAQQMDVLSSMATVAGYKAVLMAAERLPKFFPLLMTAAGTISPAHVLVMGAGVAGLQAIATAKRLGAVVQAYDVRPAVAEQVESLGAKFLRLAVDTEGSEDRGGYARALGEDTQRKQRELLAKVVAHSDVVITTALVPGQPAPLLLTEEMVAGMTPGSVIVDLAAEQGGNCALTRVDEVVTKHGVTILGPGNLPASTPYHASQMFAKNVTTFVLYLLKDGKIQTDRKDEIIQETLVTHGGQVVHSRVRERLGLPPVE
jgi:NAD(P) transhydrogenase subunit alpha